MHSKTFRLFVSSTFSDFTQERKLLQTIVFPEIKNYCNEHNLVFQPIDLRWGVTDEASNNQKTLELCLEEVKASKINPHPNFLIMMGDRYGTVILPYAIEKEEFEIIQNKVTDTKDLKLLNTWYILDGNQIPDSYILQERKKSKDSHDRQDYTDRKNWKPINKKLLETLQTAVKNSNLNNEQKKKYFASATEAEIIEGIFKYLHKTDFQNKYLEEITNKDVEKIDSENVYAYIRNIKSLDKDGLKENLIDIDLTNVFLIKGNKNKKGELQKALDKDNIFSVDADLTNVARDEYDKLTYFYKELNDTKESFVSEMTKYLKRSIDKHIELIKKSNYTQEQLDQFEQERFKSDKLKDFLEGSRTNALNAIDKYLKNDNNQALVVYGKSGLGKSSLIAKAIEKSLGKKDEQGKYENEDKVVYRFVGATSNITTSPQLLISILKEFDIEEEIRTLKDETTEHEKPEPLENFYDRINEHFRNIKEEKVIYIDAVDQLTTEDEFIWLPSQLPNNLKIVISALEDKKYEEDSKYFENIKTKTSNLYELEPFTNAKELVDKILKRYDRKITPSQMDYFLEIYKDINTPLYLSVAAQEMRHWKSHDETIDKDPKGQKLASTQQDIIQEYIENLTKFYHHDEELVKKVFSYLYLSDGLSESELLEILNTDKEFIEKIASDKHHKKENPELPIVIWARLHTQIKEFLKLEEKDSQETIKFFHREFNQVISGEDETEELKKKEIKKIHEHLISLILEHIVKSDGRWKELYKNLSISHNIKYEDNLMLQNFAFSYASKNDLNNFYLMFNSKDYTDRYKKVAQERFRTLFAKYFYENTKSESEVIHCKNMYKISLTNLSFTLKNIGNIKEAKLYDDFVYDLEKETLQKELGRKERPKDFVLSAINSASSMIRNGDNKNAIELLEGARPYGKILIKSGNYAANTLNATLLANLAEAYIRENKDNLLKSIDLLEEASKLTEGDNREEVLEKHILILNNLAKFYRENDYNNALKIAKKAISTGYIFLAMGRKKLLEPLLETYNILGFLYLEMPEEDWVREKNRRNINNKFELILPLANIALDKLKNDIHPDEQSFFLETQIRLQYLKTKCMYELNDRKAKLEWKELNKLIIQSDLSEYNSYLDDLLQYRVNNSISINEISEILKKHDDALNEIVKVLFFCIEPMPFEKLLKNNNFTESTPYDMVYLDPNGGKQVVESIIGQHLKIPSLVYYVNGCVENIIFIDNLKEHEGEDVENVFTTASTYLKTYNKPSETLFPDGNSVKFNHIILIANSLADYVDDDEICAKHFLDALMFIELEKESRLIFEKYFNFTTYKFRYGGEEHIEYSKDQKLLEFSKTIFNMIKELKNIFKDKPIGIIRSNNI